jgi:hypothetical protein
MHRHGLSVGHPVIDANDHAERRNPMDGDDNVDAFVNGDLAREVVPIYENTLFVKGDGVDFNVGIVHMDRAKNHIERLKESFKQDFGSKYNLSDAEKAQK